LTSPAASEQSRQDCEAICKLGLKAKILTHVRCHMDDARIAVETGVDGLDGKELGGKRERVLGGVGGHGIVKIQTSCNNENPILALIFCSNLVLILTREPESESREREGRAGEGRNIE
jgi:hypothetical protein